MAQGAVSKRNGTWAFRVDCFHPGTGKRRQISRQGFPTKTAAVVALHEIVQSDAQGTVVTRTSIRLREYLEDSRTATPIQGDSGTEERPVTWC